MPPFTSGLTLAGKARRGKALAMLFVLPLVILLGGGVPLTTVVPLGLLLRTAGLLVCLVGVADG
jgi:hypothetical protein